MPLKTTLPPAPLIQMVLSALQNQYECTCLIMERKKKNYYKFFRIRSSKVQMKSFNIETFCRTLFVFLIGILFGIHLRRKKN